MYDDHSCSTKQRHIHDRVGAMLFPKLLRKKYSLKRRNRYGIEES
jgi:hypothetical protein